MRAEFGAKAVAQAMGSGAGLGRPPPSPWDAYLEREGQS